MLDPVYQGFFPEGATGTSTAVAPDGSVFVFGTTNHALGDAGEPTVDLHGTQHVAFLLKYSWNGALLWARTLWDDGPVASTKTSGDDMAATADGGVIVTGAFDLSLRVSPGPANPVLTALARDAFLVRFDLDGNVVWAKQANGSSVRGWSVAVGADGSIGWTGSYDVAVLGPGEPNQTTLLSAGLQDVFVAKLDAGGSLLWARGSGGTDNDVGLGVTVADSGEVVATGVIRATATFGAGEVNQTSLVATPNYGPFVARYSPVGALLWAKGASGGFGTLAYDVAATSDGGSVTVGSFNGPVTLNPGEAGQTLLTAGAGQGSGFAARHSPTGALVWATGFPLGDMSSSAAAHSIGVAPDGSLRVGLQFSGTIQPAPGMSFQSLSYYNPPPNVVYMLNPLVLRLEANGAVTWGRQIASTQLGRAVGIAVSPFGDVVATGSLLCGQITFNAGAPGAVQQPCNENGVFVERIAP